LNRSLTRKFNETPTVKFWKFNETPTVKFCGWNRTSTTL